MGDAGIRVGTSAHPTNVARWSPGAGSPLNQKFSCKFVNALNRRLIAVFERCGGQGDQVEFELIEQRVSRAALVLSEVGRIHPGILPALHCTINNSPTEI
jgi:hypothetical protein